MAHDDLIMIVILPLSVCNILIHKSSLHCFCVVKTYSSEKDGYFITEDKEPFL
ncbi:Uncharacterized protein dnm_047830 [Desulfonema magnum]|uniref:Uncharacterized protein n=1 Tax=Desulfonema magnum TaxID=45655 RepID=A0A975GP80_9BACT|nr:Uncharacterized protein dnm_047830 [Desulfonema magnum]